MLVGWYIYTCDLITLGRKLIYHSTLTSALKHNILVKVIGLQFAWKLMYLCIHHCRHTCASDLITLGNNVICLSILTYALRQTYLYKLFDHTWQEMNLSFHSDQCSLAQHTCASDSITIGRNFMYHSILANDLRQIYLYKWIDHAWQVLLNHFLTYDLRQTYLYKWFVHTWKELNLSFHSDQYFWQT